ncbi:hypothetical protein PR048_010953, partial [Dryococelus australis]
MKELVTELITLYKEQPYLWQVISKEYTNKNLKNEACDKLLKNEMKKVLDSKHNGSSTDELYTPTLWYYDILLFAMDQEMPSASVLNMGVGDRSEERPPLTLVEQAQNLPRSSASRNKWKLNMTVATFDLMKACSSALAEQKMDDFDEYE